ncbi:type 1 fimbrial protein [Pantoea sp. Bo_2]|uniref:fimbrial protein n=1 Tax=unclassified Pantoea TaxID=2630326 RepID=UPI001231FCF2|nr:MULTISPECIES: fimbrial protein [unclassified Pantoea]KAA5948785.1 type 1 fimbrial protein [Pantoea sp. VH_3]KAA5955168.1 type 1 fimbrial protein [Pantoea sp. VH_25]KAA5957634.1 type 1 fimbrial protein [Pantoea sp. VH_24]KAA5962649.1 type 1 fimbrial protein [Pantoea sp. VH_16]KAA5966878.1 type 1 fimbrial protein [Pantoea sp. VH_18]
MINSESKYGRYLIMILLIPLLYLPPVRAGDSNLYGEVNINVTVLAPPCDINEEDQSGISVLFPPVSYRQFYNQGASPEAPFTLRLSHCDISQAKSVRSTFTGPEEDSLPGLLALSPQSEAKGIAVGIKSAGDGKQIKINKKSDAFALAEGDMAFHFIAWLQATPEALTDHTIEAGEFTAQAVISLSYE